MSTFDERENAFESKFAHDEELQFKAVARRNKLVGLWAADGERVEWQTKFLDIHEKAHHVTAAHAGLADIKVSIVQGVAEGDHIATVYDVHNFGVVLDEVRAPVGGLVAVRRRNPLVSPGDHLCLIAPEIESVP